MPLLLLSMSDSPPPASEPPTPRSPSRPPNAHFNPFEILPETESDTSSDASDDSKAVVSDDESSAPSSAPSTASDEEEESDGDSSSDFQPHYRERLRAGAVIKHQYRTLAAIVGAPSTHAHRLQLLGLQHRMRTHDVAFTLRQRGPLPASAAGAAAPPSASAALDQPRNPIDPAIPTLTAWRRWRERNVHALGITTDLPQMVIRGGRRVRGQRGRVPDVTVYRCIAAHVNVPEVLINRFFRVHRPASDTTVVAICADAVDSVDSGTPARGKCYGMFAKPMMVAHPQSPEWLIPILFSLGLDNFNTLSALFESVGLDRIVASLSRTVFGPSRSLTSLVLFFSGDYPACTAMIVMVSPARHYPRTPGRVLAWTQEPICWHCRITPSIMYHADRARAYTASYDPDARPVPMATTNGIPAFLTFYEIVHLVAVIIQSIVCDIGIFYLRCCSDYLHPVAAFVHTLFPKLNRYGNVGWDPFLVYAISRSKDRRSRKPLYACDPAVVWSWVMDVDAQKLFITLLEQHPVSIYVPGARDGVATPARLWITVLDWFDAVQRAQSDRARVSAMIAEDVWRCMLGISSPVPPDVPCHDPAGHTSFFPMITAYGPASHTGFCSTWRFIRFINGACPEWRDSGMTFAKFASMVALENAMGQLRACYRNFGIAGGQRRFRARELLLRRVERFGLKLVEQIGSGDKDSDDDADGGADGSANRSYKDIPLGSHVLIMSEPGLPGKVLQRADGP